MKTRFFLIIILLLVLPTVADAQCAMCRAVVESEADGRTAEGINNGIVYLMAVPYVPGSRTFLLHLPKNEGLTPSTPINFDPNCNILRL